MSGRFSEESQKAMQRSLLAKLGFSENEIEDTLNAPAPVPSEDEIRTLVKNLLTPDSLEQARNALESKETREHAIPFLQEAFFSNEFVNASSGPRAHHTVVKMLCDLSPEFIAERITDCMSLDEKDLVNTCLTAAFATKFEDNSTVLKSIIEQKNASQVIASFYGLRKRRWNDDLLDAERQTLYPISLEVCLPDFPLNEELVSWDPVSPFSQVFGDMAIVDLSSPPYFTASNPHLENIISCFPNVVSMASEELVAEILGAFSNPSDKNQIYVCRRLLPLATKRLLNSELHARTCKTLADELIEHPNDDIQTAALNAKVIITCGRDPFSDAIKSAEQDGFEQLSIEEQAMLLCWGFDGEVRNGGVRQFLSNDHFNRAQHTLESLQLLGLTAGFTLLDAAMKAYSSTTAYQTTQHFQSAVRGGGDQEITSQTREHLKDLENEYYIGEKNCKRLIFEFILGNSVLFQASPKQSD